MLSEVLVGRAVVRIPVLSLRPVQCPQGIHEVIETGDVTSEAEGNPQSDLPRRYAGNEPVPDRTGNRDPGDPLSSPTSGIQDQLGKVPSLPITTNTLPGIRPELPHTDNLTSRGKDGEYQLSLPEDYYRGKVYSKTVVKDYWYDVSNNVGRCS